MHEGGMGEGSAMSKVERIRRLERWAETAMHELMRANRLDADVPKAQANIARSAWNMAVAMEDERTRVIEALRNLEPGEV